MNTEILIITFKSGKGGRTMATGKDFGLRTIISRNNQTWVTIPKKIVDQYKIKKGEKVRFFCDSNGVDNN